VFPSMGRVRDLGIVFKDTLWQPPALGIPLAATTAGTAFLINHGLNDRGDIATLFGLVLLAGSAAAVPAISSGREKAKTRNKKELLLVMTPLAIGLARLLAMTADSRRKQPSSRSSNFPLSF
jgi:hypothetical protein